MRTWIDACVELAGDEPWTGVLSAFANPFPRGGPPTDPEPPWPGSFDALEREALGVSLDLAPTLARDVDPAQAAMFERRLGAVDRALAEITEPAARVLRVGLRMRAAGILDAPPPRASRIRALADFYYSQLGLLTASPGVPLPELVASASWRTHAPGVEVALLDGASDHGPVHVNLLRADPTRIRGRVVDLRADSQPFAEYALQCGSLAAFSGGFFLYSEADITPPSRRHDPVGLLVSDGRVESPPVFRRGALLLAADGSLEIRRVGLGDLDIVHERSGTQLPGVDAINRAAADVGPDRRSAAIVGARVTAVGARLPVPLNGFVVPTPHEAIAPGDPIAYRPPTTRAEVEVRDAIAGGPLLIENGERAIDMRADELWGTAPPVTFSQDETGDRNLLPRQAVGIDRAGRLVVAAVDGRNLERALGMTIGDVATLMSALDCRFATNLDGGSSKRFVLGGRTMDLPSTEIVATGDARPDVRPVYTALMLFAHGQKVVEGI